MKNRITVLIDEELMLLIAKEVYKKSRMARMLKMTGWILAFPIMVWMAFGLVESMASESMKNILLDIIFVLLAGAIFWFSVYGHRVFYMRRNQKEAKKIEFPVEQTIEFDEKELIVSNDVLAYKIAWDNIEVSCETENYWFVGPVTAAIDKRMLTQEQYQLLSEKCQIIAMKNKRI